MKKLLSIAVLAATFATSCRNKNNDAFNFTVNEKASKAEWKGSAPDHFHVGSFKVSGSLTAAADGAVKSGDFIIPIASIEDFDLPANVKPALLADLKDNFFKIATHPEARFHITSAKPYKGTDTSAVKGANYLLAGEFSMIGQTHPISFPARITAKDGNFTAEAKFNIDRTKWGMNNYSDPKKKLYILPEVNIHLNIQASAIREASQPVAMISK